MKVHRQDNITVETTETVTEAGITEYGSSTEGIVEYDEYGEISRIEDDYSDVIQSADDVEQKKNVKRRKSSNITGNKKKGKNNN